MIYNESNKFILHLDKAKRICKVIIVVFFVLFIVDMVIFALNSNISIETFSNTRQDSTVAISSKLVKKPLTYYSVQLSKAKLFRPGIVSPSQRPTWASDRKTNLKSIDDRLKNISITGIILGDDPSVFIYDSKDQKTISLKLGQSIQGFLIKEIRKDGLTLQAGNQEYNMNL